MKASSAVQAFKSLASRIHPQLPLSGRESQRLLNALTSSFRQQLDHDSSPTAPHPSSTTVTDRHLASILTNPLVGKPVRSAAASHPGVKSKHPIVLFEDHVASGHATLDSARSCLHAFRRSLESLSPVAFKEEVRKYAAGSRALRWLWSSGSTQTLSFAEDRRFLDELSYFLVIEGRESALWELVETSISASQTQSAKDTRKRKGQLLCSIVKTHLTASPDNISSALGAFFRALELPSSQSPVLQAGTYLSRELIKHPFPASQIPLFDRFVDTCSRWDNNAGDRPLYRAANLRLNHPSTPSAEHALEFIRRLKPTPSHPFLELTTRTASHKKTVFKFFFDTVRLLQKQGHFDDAAWVMEFMQHKFPDDFAHIEQIEQQVTKVSSPVTQSFSSSDTSNETILPDWRAPEFG